MSIPYERFPSSENPLSADIFVIGNYIFDTGASDEAKAFLNSIPNKIIVISHFHADHSTNVRRVDFDKLYGGKKTCDYLKTGIVVSERLILDETLNIQIAPLTSCHAKGSLMMNLNNEYLFVGDSLCGCSLPDGQYGFNAGMLLSTIRELEKENFKNAVVSHSGDLIPKDAVLRHLKEIYNRRDGNNPYICIKQF